MPDRDWLQRRTAETRSSPLTSVTRPFSLEPEEPVAAGDGAALGSVDLEPARPAGPTSFSLNRATVLPPGAPPPSGPHAVGPYGHVSVEPRLPLPERPARAQMPSAAAVRIQREPSIAGALVPGATRAKTKAQVQWELPAIAPASSTPALPIQRELSIDDASTSLSSSASRPKKRARVESVSFTSRDEFRKYWAKDWKAGRALYALIKTVTRRPKVVYNTFKAWADDIDDHSYDTWKGAAIAALREVQQSERGQLHEPIAPMSPLRQDQSDEIDYLTGPGRTAERMKPGAVWGELKIHGQLGEHAHQRMLKRKRIEFEDANQALGYNAPGIDTIQNLPQPFAQSKMHLSELDEGAVKNVYLGHVQKKKEYSKTLAKHLFADSNRGRNMRKGIKTLSKKWDNPALKELSGFFTEQWIGEDVEDLSMHKGRGPVEVIAEGMVFPVPKDIYPLIPSSSQSHFVALPEDRYWFSKVKEGMQYRGHRGKKTEEELEMEDEDYNEG